MPTVSTARRRHILGGDTTGGGHRAGNGLGRSEFLAEWSDDKIIQVIESIADDPGALRSVQPNGRIRIEGVREDIRLRVIVDADAVSIRTAHPISYRGMDRVAEDSHQSVEAVFADLLASLAVVWPERDVAYVRDEVAHGEFGDALDNLIAIGLNNGCGFDGRQRERIEFLAGVMQVTGSEFLAALRSAPASPRA